ncbi:glycoside hydrolase family 47 protein [Actinacidiphila glaucinigra]|uniref:glycoside hydrolase family 47 protein n=1 Tax=Actinacidiphila glaucinigra TaxID=235986 RepID=UPI002DDA3EAD|nr:glycoside hydrolase family 47 protein [Actinacidiphila glaucinigra]WSD64731.1 glycoside hydrolase family 47 protein [Actinacidiphila glaucinigra]
MRATDPSSPLRPEYVDSCLSLWLVTGKELYRERVREMFDRQERYCEVAGGYTVVRDVTASPVMLGDLTPAYWSSRTPSTTTCCSPRRVASTTAPPT